MSPSRFAKDRKARDVTPYREEPAPASVIPFRPTTPHPDRQPSPIVDRPVTPAPPEWTSVDAPINFTWVIPDELCGMGWPKSRDQVRFLVEQGIDHLVSLSPEKIPPHYAFPNLNHTLIPVEDFTGPTIAEIQKFLEITDDARRDGEAVGVHCAEGRGRTGVMCACYLIYYYDMEPWDAIRIMRRQRPGSVERKVQEETVVRFFTLLQDYGKSSLENLEKREKDLLEKEKRQQAELIR
ncbi:dual specificity protein phosphatase 23 [Eurytemora carolleeae]|uniref:dual specificity protein phosphatase 23 n=1 Tax=Eurytemora carolleeae TaxID=1294199 RepID=UPI000C76F9F3|nr:dual specificity protein phosphatase 23 [Eurytemora carolleeae]|eukprot:XP_023324300.1 dual specificity protein phosphatase 23-like [Eurytemora affinis]